MVKAGPFAFSVVLLMFSAFTFIQQTVMVNKVFVDSELPKSGETAAQWHRRQWNARIDPKCKDRMKNFVFPLVGMVYVINLDRSVDRMEHMASMLKRLRMPFRRVPGVEVAADHPQRGRMQSASGRLMSVGAVGAWLGHIRAWEAIVEGDDEWGLVLEDDVKLEDGIDYLRWMQAIPRDISTVVKLDYAWLPHKRRQKEAQQEGACDQSTAKKICLSKMEGAVAYLISKATATKFVQRTRGIVFQVPVDLWMPCEYKNTKLPVQLKSALQANSMIQMMGFELCLQRKGRLEEAHAGKLSAEVLAALYEGCTYEKGKY